MGGDGVGFLGVCSLRSELRGYFYKSRISAVYIGMPKKRVIIAYSKKMCEEFVNSVEKYYLCSNKTK